MEKLGLLFRFFRDGEHGLDEEIERLGSALMKLEEKMDELKRVFGLSDDDLNLKLGSVKSLD